MSPLKRPRDDEIFDDCFGLEVVKPASTLTTTASSTYKATTMPRTAMMSHRDSMRINTSNNDLLPVDMLNDEACFSPTNDVMMSPDNNHHPQDGYEPTAQQEDCEREIFDKARHYLNPGPLLRYAIYIFGERKLFTFFCVHFMCTMVIWGKLAL